MTSPVRHHVKSHRRGKASVRDYNRGSGRKVANFKGEYQTDGLLSRFKKTPITREEKIQKEQKRLYDAFYRKRDFSLGINAKNYTYPKLEDFREQAIINLERKHQIA